MNRPGSGAWWKSSGQGQSDDPSSRIGISENNERRSWQQWGDELN
jgi:hypothetical protein